MKSFNIVGETAQFLNVVYTTINRKTINLIIQLFNTLNEFCSVKCSTNKSFYQLLDHSNKMGLIHKPYFQGNQENRVVVYDRKLVDYINFILRAGDIADCGPEKVRHYVCFGVLRFFIIDIVMSLCPIHLDS